MPVESNKYSDISYQIIETPFMFSDSGARMVYGLRSEFVGDTTEVITVKDISSCKDDVERLVVLMTECGVTSEHLMDIVEDFVQNLYI
jgi:hypothetical protein